MEIIDRPPPAPLSAAQIRALYERNPTPVGRAMVWEIWRLQRLVVALEAGLSGAGRLRHRQDIIDRVKELHDYIRDEPCLNERLAVRPGHRRGRDADEAPKR
ncbi:hypothetical protein [Bordetella bronchiseptica]|uniref:hypothetical protein n=1 Tax=Bordetella bronchiseptica TaxID=518 RepID=UPI0012D2C7FD|nr:hypothetical protein [Bordetella bronchiseptica]